MLHAAHVFLQVDVFIVPSLSLGNLKNVSIWHDGSGYFPTWFLKNIRINETFAGMEPTFTCSCWIKGNKVRPAIAKDSMKRPGTKGIKSPSQIPGQSPSLTSVEQDWKHQGPEDSDFRPPAQVLTAPHPMIQ